MFCSNCGENIEDINTKFCPLCGSKIQNDFQGQAQKTNINYQNPYIVNKQPSNSYLNSAIPSQKPIMTNMGTGSHSKKCLAFSIVSLGLAAAGLILGFFGFFIRIINYNTSRFFIPQTLPIIIFYIVGLIFGISSRLNSNRARLTEAQNTPEKIGSVLSIFGIIANIAGIVFFIIMFVFTSGIWNTLYYYM